MKQTAVEWLVGELMKPEANINAFEIIQEALEMEKQQIIESNRDGVDMCVYKKPFISGEQYYNETFKSDEI